MLNLTRFRLPSVARVCLLVRELLVDFDIPEEYSVQLDTGSSDLWIKPSVSPLPGATSTVSSLRYISDFKTLTQIIQDTVYNISVSQSHFVSIVRFQPPPSMR